MYAKKWLVPVSLVITVAACSGDSGQDGQGGMPPTPVTVAQVEAENVTYYAEYAARVRGAREAEVAAQVSGILQERRFDEGTMVEAGQTLFLIDPEPYQIQLATAQAELADAQSAQRQAQSEWRRVSGLYEQNAVSQRDYEQAQSSQDAAQARVLRAQAAVNDAERNLRYTRVESPVSGIVGSENYTVGNLIQSGTSLTHVTQVDPIRLHFSMPESDAWMQRRSRLQSDNAEHLSQAWAVLPDGSTFAEVGQINFIDPRVNESSASVAVRAQLANPDGELMPGQFIRARVILNEFVDVFKIEPSAIRQGGNGDQVFVVHANDEVEAVNVELGPIIDGRQLVLSGLNNGDRIVINGHVALQSGASVQVTNQTDGEE